MSNYEPPETGTFLIATLLILALGFAGYWIMLYAEQRSPPWELARWFLIIAGVVIAVAGVVYLLRTRKRD